MTGREKQEIYKTIEPFGVTIDKEGYVTLYHGTIKPVSKLKKGEIFFMTADREVAEEYARMRENQAEIKKRGVVIEIRVKPTDVYWNQGTYEIEYSKGGEIREGQIIPPGNKDKRRGTGQVYYQAKEGQRLPRTKNKLIQIVKNKEGRVQFYLEQVNGKKGWFDAHTVMQYENGVRYREEYERGGGR